MKKFLLVFLLMGCDQKLIPTPQGRVQYIRYYKDERTGLCFVDNTVNNGHVPFDDHIYTNVPCSPEVEKLIQK